MPYLERNCICCTQWSFDPGHPGFSEWTPGYDWSMTCGKHHWHMSGMHITEDEYRMTLLKGQDCPDYYPIQIDIPTKD